MNFESIQERVLDNLKYWNMSYKGLYSKRITRKHRLIYDIKDKVVTVLIISAYTHYGDK